MGTAKEREGDVVEDVDAIDVSVELDAHEMFDGLLNEDLADAFDELPDASAVNALPEWCVEAVADTAETPDTPPKKRGRPPKAASPPRTAKAQGKQRAPRLQLAKVINKSAPTGVPRTTLPGYFRVVQSSTLSPPVDFTVMQKAKPRSAKQQLVLTPPAQVDLLCRESSADLAAAGDNWRQPSILAYTIRNGKMVPQSYMYARSFKLGGVNAPLVPANLSLEQALAFCA